jgi:transposase InsO family protein
VEKKFPELIARIDREWPGEGPIRVMFQDEARFGRISDTRRCWCPKPVRPWENGYIESFNGKLRDGLLNGEIFTTLLEAKVLIENWRREYNTIRPRSSLGYKPPAPEAIMPGGKYLMGRLTLKVVQ